MCCPRPGRSDANCGSSLREATVLGAYATKSVGERLLFLSASDHLLGIQDHRINHDTSCPLQAPRPTSGPAPQLSLLMLPGAEEAVALSLISLLRASQSRGCEPALSATPRISRGASPTRMGDSRRRRFWLLRMSHVTREKTRCSLAVDATLASLSTRVVQHAPFWRARGRDTLRHALNTPLNTKHAQLALQ